MNVPASVVSVPPPSTGTNCVERELGSGRSWRLYAVRLVLIARLPYSVSARYRLTLGRLVVVQVIHHASGQCFLPSVFERRLQASEPTSQPEQHRRQQQRHGDVAEEEGEFHRVVEAAATLAPNGGVVAAPLLHRVVDDRQVDGAHH